MAGISVVVLADADAGFGAGMSPGVAAGASTVSFVADAGVSADGTPLGSAAGADARLVSPPDVDGNGASVSFFAVPLAPAVLPASAAGGPGDSFVAEPVSLASLVPLG